MMFKKFSIVWRSIQMQMALRAVGIMTVTLCLLGMFQYYEIQVGKSAELQKSAEGTVAKLAEYLQTPMWYANQDLVKKTLESAMLDHMIYGILVRDESDKLFAGIIRDRDWQVEETDRAPEKDDMIVTHKTITKNEEAPLGSVELYLTKRFLHAQLNQQLQKLILTLIVANSVVFLLSWVMMRGITQSIRQIVTVATEIAKGDLTRPIHVTQRNEIGELADAFQEMLATLNDTVHDAKTAMAQVAEKSEEMNDIAAQMSQGANEQAAAAEEVSSSMEEMTANIRQTAENAKSAVTKAEQSASDAREGRRAVDEILIAMETIANEIDSIQQIADRTNILSLNATIEAARAYEYGRGFGVVASSVRDLAESSRLAADNIRLLVKDCMARSAQAKECLSRLMPNSEQTSELVKEIAAASQEQTSGGEQINYAIQQLDNVIQVNAATSESLASSADILAAQAGQLQERMAFFTVMVAETSAEVNDQEVLGRIQELEQQLQDLRAIAHVMPADIKNSETTMPIRHSDLLPKTLPDDVTDQDFERY